MAVKEYNLLAFYQQYIKDTAKGKRTKPNGELIKPQSVNNYNYTFNLLQEFEQLYEYPLRIKEYSRLNSRERVSEANYWKKFNQKFMNYLYSYRKVYDNYAGTVVKQIKAFFRYVNNERLIDTGPYYKSLKAMKEEVPVTALSRENLIQLIYDKEFEQLLAPNLQISKDMFVFGCTVALRFSDLSALTSANFELQDGQWYMKTLSKKTKTYVTVKLPAYAVDILLKYRTNTKKPLFRKISLLNFNKHLKLLGEQMGLIQPVIRARSRKGIIQDTKEKAPRFCDLMSSHLMRRTAITNMLTLGMPEVLIKHISGHIGNSKSFYRYVNYSQAYMNTELDKVYANMGA